MKANNKNGYWTGFNGNKCSECGTLCEEAKDGMTPNFCPNCGADMREGEKESKMTIHERLAEAGYENILLLDNYSYDDAFVGVSNDDRAVYDYDKMIDWLVKTQGFSVEDAVEWIDYNTIRALPYHGNEAPIILNRLDSENEEATNILKEFADRLKEELTKIIIPRGVNDPEEANLDSDQVWDAIDSLVMQMTGQKA